MSDLSQTKTAATFTNHKTNSYESEIRRIVAAATGGSDPLGIYGAMIRFHVWNPAHDPRSSLQVLSEYADLTDSVINRLRITKKYKDLQRTAVPPERLKGMLKAKGCKDHSRESIFGSPDTFKAEWNQYFNNIRRFAWASGTTGIEWRLKYAINHFLKDAPQADKDSLQTFMETNLDKDTWREEKRRIAHRYESRRRQKSIRGIIQSIGSAEQRTHDAIAEDLQDLRQSEMDTQTSLAQEIAQYEDVLPELIRKNGDLYASMDTALQIYREFHARAEKLLNEKERIFRAIEEKGGQADDYETADSVRTLIQGPSDFSTSKIENFNHNRAPQNNNQAINTDDIDGLIRDMDNPVLVDAAQQVIDLRTANATLHDKKAHLKQQCEELERSAMALEQGADKATRRSIALEEAITDLAEDIEDLTVELNDVNEAPSSLQTQYPPLSELESWTEKNLKGRVRISRKAFSTAASLPFSHKNPERIYRGLELLANEYWEQRTAKGSEAVQKARIAFREKAHSINLRHRPSVSDTTLTPKLRSQYEAVFDGEKRFMDQHLRSGSSSPDSAIRIYFTFDNDTIFVGHLPTHLETLGYS